MGNGNTVKIYQPGDTVQIAGAGPSGLAAAITFAHAGVPVVVHEAQKEVGHRFGADLQGLENWSTEQDVLDDMRNLGLSTGFAVQPGLRGTAYDAWDNAYPIECPKPLFYMVERGPGPESFDTALLNQALSLGVEIKFNSLLRSLEGPGILATGPQAADAIAVGFHFETDMENGFWVICDDNLAPKGYAYLLTMNGKGTIKSCMFSRFKHKQRYIERTVEAFERLVGLKMHNPRPHGGVGNFHVPLNAIHGGHPIVGEQAGFQDTLWGFGMRYAMTSGILAAQSIIDGADYNTQWQRVLVRQLQTSVVNRLLYSKMRNRGYRFFLRLTTRQPDIRGFLRNFYKMSMMKRILLPWSQRRYVSQMKMPVCGNEDCSSVRCRCGTTT